MSIFPLSLGKRVRIPHILPNTPLSNVSMTFSVHLRQASTDSIAVFLYIISPHQFKNLKTISYAHITHIKILVKFNVFSNIINLKSKNVNMLIFLSFKITEKIVLNLKACPRKKPSAWCGGSSINKNRQRLKEIYIKNITKSAKIPAL